MNEKNTDKCLMEDILLLEKGVCDLFMHGSIESSTENVHHAFQLALNEGLVMQNELYSKMSEKGWYQEDNVESYRLAAVKDKFSSQG